MGGTRAGFRRNTGALQYGAKPWHRRAANNKLPRCRRKRLTCVRKPNETRKSGKKNPTRKIRQKRSRGRVSFSAKAKRLSGLSVGRAGECGTIPVGTDPDRRGDDRNR